MNDVAQSLRPFELTAPGRIVFGSGTAKSLGAEARKLGRRALFVTGKDRARVAKLEQDLLGAGLELSWLGVASEPTVDDALRGVELGRARSVELVVACGGGSAIDLGKAVAALLANAEDPFEFLEVVGRARPLLQPALPLIAVPTTAGTGAQAPKKAEQA
jgi:alcohol dehydrogenase class IV